MLGYSGLVIFCMIPPLMEHTISRCVAIIVFLHASAALAQVGYDQQMVPNATEATTPPPPMPTPPGQPVYQPPAASVQPTGSTAPPSGQANWPPPAQPVLQSTTPYVPSDGSVLPPATQSPAPYVPSDQAVNRQPGTYMAAPSQPEYPPPPAWFGAPSPGLGLIPGASNPRWDVSVDALWLTRDTGQGILLGFTEYNNNASGRPAVQPDSLWTDDELFPLTPGVRFQLVGRITDHSSIETTCWGFQDWSIGRVIYGDPAGQTILGHSTWLQMPDIDDSLGYTYGSQAANVEFNHRLRLLSVDPYRSVSWLWGFRYLHFADDLTLTASDLYTGGNETLNWQTNNNLIALQLGLQWAWGWDRFQLSVEGKVGLGANVYSQQGTDSASGVAGFQAFDESHNGTSFAAIFELSMLLRYRVTSNLWLRAGYQCYSMTGLALSPRQLAEYNASGTVDLNGLSLGAELTW
jgi:hypothetical protein